jgi:Flp pilus assembly protein TadG
VIAQERGQAAVEALVVAPVLLVLVALLIAGGRLTSNQASLRAVAREAGRIAVAAASSGEAIRLGEQRALEVARGYGLDLSRLEVAVMPGAFARGGDVRVRVGYSARLSDLPSLGLIPGGTRLTAGHVEPIDIHRSR